MANFVLAFTPKYVGIQEGNVFIWQTEYNKDKLRNYYQDYYEDYFEELGYDPELLRGLIDELIDNRTSFKDIEAFKIVVLKIGDEEDILFGGEGVQVIYNYYITENFAANDWIRDEKDETFAIFDDDEIEIYADLMKNGFPYNKKGLDSEGVPYFISNSLKWEDIIGIIENYYDNLKYETYKGEIEENQNGIYFIIDDDDDEDDFEESKYIFKYTNTGVLLYYEWLYDGEPIIRVELQWSFFHEYGFWIILGFIILISLISVITTKILIKRINK